MKNKKYNHPLFQCGELIKRNLFSIIIVVLFSTTFNLSAQTVPPKSQANDLKILKDPINHKVNLEFRADKEILNLLILVTDSLGHTIFLDNQYHFKGNYKHSVDFKEAGKGRYFLKIIKDDEQINEDLNIE